MKLWLIRSGLQRVGVATMGPRLGLTISSPHAPQVRTARPMGINQEINDVSTKAGMTLALMMEIVDEARSLRSRSQPSRRNTSVSVERSFVCHPGNDIWVWFGDLPNETLKRLREKHRWL